MKLVCDFVTCSSKLHLEDFFFVEASLDSFKIPTK